MTTVGTTQTFYYQLDGVDTLCESGAGSAGNSCAIHIHTGRTCVDNALGHHHTGAVTTDPWTSVSYTSDSAGASSGSVTVDTGAGSGEVAGRAFIIHGYDSGRIGCAILGAAPPSPPVGASIMQDPHMDLAHNGHADFRGKHKSLYNYLSTPGLSVNVLIEEALYTLHDGKLLVNGTYMTEVHVAALVEGDRQCKWAYVSYVASQLNGSSRPHAPTLYTPPLRPPMAVRAISRCPLQGRTGAGATSGVAVVGMSSSSAPTCERHSHILSPTPPPPQRSGPPPKPPLPSPFCTRLAHPPTSATS